MRTAVRSLLCGLLAAALLLGCTGNVLAIDSSFFSSHTDWHFDLRREPDRAMRVDELIALSTAYSYWGTGSQTGVLPRDKNGNLPADWAAPYIRAEYAKGTFDPTKIAYDAPADLAFWLQFVAGCKGLYSFNANNLYTFTGVELDAEQRLLMSAAVDYGLAAYTENMDVSGPLLRRDLERRYQIPPDKLPQPKPVSPRARNVKWTEAFFVDAFQGRYADELEHLKAAEGCFNLISMHLTALERDGANGSFLAKDRIGEAETFRETIDYCKAQGIRVVLGVHSPEDDRREITMRALMEHPERIPLAADELVGLAETYGLDGIDLCIEVYNKSYRGTYSALLEALAERLHARGRLLLATVGGFIKSSDERESIYDYQVIGRCCDLVNLTMYDDHSRRAFLEYAAGPGEYSNYTYTQRRILYALANFGPEKLIASYGLFVVDYNLTRHLANNISRRDLAALCARYGATVQTHGMPTDDSYIEYTTENGDRHVVYFDSDAALRRRIDLAAAYGLAGVNVFSLLYDAPEVFDAMRQTRNALPFLDVGPGWYCDSVRWALDRDITTGISPTVFGPDRGCTRAQVVTFLWRAAGCPAHDAAAPFRDVPPDAYYADAVAWAVEQGITTGTGPGRFSPGATCTRAQIVTFLWRFHRSPAPPARGTPFRDVVSGAYYHAAVAWAVGDRITTGTGPDRFSPDSTCTRAQVVTFLYRDLGAEPK